MFSCKFSVSFVLVFEDPGGKEGRRNGNVIKVYEDHQILFKLNRKEYVYSIYI